MDVQRIVSSITGVVDSTGTTIGNPGTTNDTVLSLSGIGTANSVVFIFDNGVLLTPASVTINGTWRLTATVALGRHEFTVRDELGGVDSPEWVVIVEVVAVKPEITSVLDSKGEVEQNGTTFDTAVTLKGTAKASEVVELFQDGALLGDVPVDANGDWMRSVTGLTVSSYNFQARARYGSNPVSGLRSLTVLASLVPTISSIKDAAGTEIPANGTTFSTSVTLTGIAVAGQEVQIFDGSTSLGTVTATGGTWTLPLTGLAFKAYSIKARGLYGSNPESAVRGFTVAVATAPTITSVRDSNGEVSNGGSTTDTSVSLVGTAAANQQVQIFDNGANKGTASVNGSGGWNSSVSGLALGSHSITAKAHYGSEPVSNARTFTVRSPTPQLVIDTSPVTLSGKLYSPGTTNPVTWPANTTITRTPTSGQPPYSYESSNSTVAVVDSSGLVKAQENGSTSITVRDSAGQTASYFVSVTGVVECLTWSYLNWNEAVGAVQGAGKRMPSITELHEIFGQYSTTWPAGRDWTYSSTQSSVVPLRNYCLHFGSGAQSEIIISWPGNVACVVGI